MTLFRKISRAYAKGMLRRYASDYLMPHLIGAKHLLYNPASDIRLHAPAYCEPDPDERPIVERIFAAFKRMKQAETSVSSVYMPSHAWRAQLRSAYSPLYTALERNDLHPFHFFLSNFGCWERYHGVEAGLLIKSCATSLLKARYCQNELFLKPLQVWDWIYGGRKDIGALSYPRHGNQAGAYVNGVFMGPGSFGNEVYGAILDRLLRAAPRPVVGELGGGYGKLAYFALRDQDQFCYIDFDLPETLCLAAYYLMKAFPQRPALLYGEAEYTPRQHESFDLILMPQFELAKLGRRSVDLFLNKNSLGEMTAESVRNYLAIIQDATEWFFHLNHDREVLSDGQSERGLLAHEYPVRQDLFSLVFRHPDLFHSLQGHRLNLNQDIVGYLYKRRESPRPSLQEMIPDSCLSSMVETR